MVLVVTLSSVPSAIAALPAAVVATAAHNAAATAASRTRPAITLPPQVRAAGLASALLALRGPVARPCPTPVHSGQRPTVQRSSIFSPSARSDVPAGPGRAG